MLVIGDLFQLEPVLDGIIFKDLGAGYGPLAPNLWKDYFTMIELTEIMRQKDDLQFAQMLNRIREGKLLDEDIALLESRIVKDPNDQSLLDITHLYPTNKEVESHNTTIFNNCSSTDKVYVEAIDVILGDVQTKVKSKCLACISNEVTTNVDVEDGITNGGAIGILKYIDYRDDKSKQPSILWILFDDQQIGKNARYKNYRFYTDNIDRSWTPIFAIKRQFALYPHFAHVQAAREQFPLRLSAARTIHKSQGSTMSKAVLKLPATARSHMPYVALSRVTSLNGIYIKELNADKISQRKDVKDEMKRLRESQIEPLSYINPALKPDCIKIAFLNSRSLHAHINDVKHDHDLLNMDIIALCETRLVSGDSNLAYDLPDYKMVRNDQEQTENRRPPHGMILYINQRFVNEITNTILNTEDNFESISVSRHGAQYVFLYRSPSLTLEQTLAKARRISENLYTSQPVVVMGDFNIDISDQKNEHVIKELEDIFQCKQIVTEITTNYGTTIDLVFTNTTAICSIIESLFSDHKIVFLHHTDSDNIMLRNTDNENTDGYQQLVID